MTSLWTGYLVLPMLVAVLHLTYRIHLLTLLLIHFYVEQPVVDLRSNGLAGDDL